MEFAIQLFVDHLTDKCRSPRTVERYLRVLKEFRTFLVTEFAGRNQWTLDQVSEDDLVRFLRQAKTERRSAPTTNNVRLAALRTFFGVLVHQRMMASNPALEIAFVPVRPREPTFLSRAEYQKLLNYIQEKTPKQYRSRNEALVVILYNTGLRVSELAALTLDMLDYATKAFRNVPLKGGEFGSVEWNRETERVLGKWLKERKNCSVDDTKELFLTRQGQPLSVRAIQDVFRSYGSSLPISKRVTPHVLRHSMATELLCQGYDIRVIADLLHHKSLNTTKRYAHLVDSLRRKALASLEPR